MLTSGCGQNVCVGGHRGQLDADGQPRCGGRRPADEDKAGPAGAGNAAAACRQRCQLVLRRQLFVMLLLGISLTSFFPVGGHVASAAGAVCPLADANAVAVAVGGDGAAVRLAGGVGEGAAGVLRGSGEDRLGVFQAPALLAAQVALVEVHQDEADGGRKDEGGAQVETGLWSAREIKNYS